MRVPTRKVTNADGQLMVINDKDFNPKVHLAVEGEEKEFEAPGLEIDTAVEVAPADGSEFNFDIPEDSGQDLSVVVPGPELPKEKKTAPKKGQRKKVTK